MDKTTSGIFVLILAIIVVFIWLYRQIQYLHQQKKALTRENVQLLADNALFEADHLKFQLQPHTINNILTNLKVMANKLNKGMDALSETLDYILYSGNTHLVSVDDEMKFIKKYLALNDLFISEIDSIKLTSSQVDINSKKFTSKCIPHLITAYFIENAFKHGDVNHVDFLNIELKLSDLTFEMNVVNRIRQKPNGEKGGLGLINMRKRLDLLYGGKYEIRNNYKDQEYFSNLTIQF